MHLTSFLFLSFPPAFLYSFILTIYLFIHLWFFLFTTALRRVVREQTYSERILGSAPDLSSTEQPCVLFPDRNFNYCKMLFLGQEMDLLLLNILSYSMFDFWLNDTASAVFLCYLLDFAICSARKSMGQVRFLIKYHFFGEFYLKFFLFNLSFAICVCVRP